MQRKRKGNDRQAYQSHIKRQEAYERGWLDDADEEYPDYGEAEAYDTEKMAGLVRGQPVVSGYEALERRRGRRKPPRKLTRREKRAMKKAEKMNEKLRREQEKAEKKAAKKEAKLAAKEERAALKKEKKKKHKTVNYSAASEKPRRSVFRHRNPYHTGKWQRTVSAGYRRNIIPKPSDFMTLTTSWHRTKIRMPFLKTGVTSSIILTAVSIFRCPLSTITAV